MKKHVATLAMMAAIAAASDNNEFGVPAQFPSGKRGYNRRKCDSKKCKSCSHFRSWQYDSRCAIKGYRNPLDMACDQYKKRKK